MKVIKPKKLEKGDIVGIVSSSLPLLPSFKENYQRGKKVLSTLGLNILEGETIKAKKWWMAGSPDQVGADINAMFNDPQVKAIIAQTGGYSALSVLEHLNFDIIRANPKPFIGFSNATNIHLACFAKTGLVGFHMADLTFGLGSEDSEVTEYNTKMFRRFLMSSEVPGPIAQLSLPMQWRKGKAKGKLIGGNLFNISNLIGTDYFPPLQLFDGAIFYWEEIGEMKVDIWARLYQLKYLGVFERIAGMVIGKIKATKKMREGEEIHEPKIEEVIMEAVKDFNFPILSGLDFGHFNVNIPMPVGLEASFDTNLLEFSILESGVI